MRMRSILLMLSFAAVTLSAAGQTTTAVVVGTVTDAQKAVLPGATVTAKNVETGAEIPVVTDANGRYRLSALRPGTYELRVELASFAAQARGPMQMFVGQESTVDFELNVSGFQESVVVTAIPPLLDTKAEISTVVDRQEIDGLPLRDRNFADLTRLSADVMSNDRIGGMQSNLSNSYFVDGVTNDRAWTGGNRAGYSAENIREFRVMTQQYAAEFGQASGGVVNVVTRSGTNNFEQRVFVFHRDDALDARNAFATSKAPFDRQQYGGFAGGPLQRNRAFYFGSYERFHEDQTAVVNTPVQRGDYDNPTDRHQVFAKVDYQLNASHQLTARVNEDRSDETNDAVGGRNTLEHGSTSFYRNHDVYSSLTSVLGGAQLNELRVAYSRRPGGSRPNTAAGPELSFPSSLQGKAYSDPQETTEARFQIVDNFSWHRGRLGGEHDFKAGFDFSRSALDGFFCNYCDGQFVFPKDVYDPADVTTYPTTYTRRIGSSDFEIPNNIYAAFIQDSWRPRPNLTLNLGVRYDYESYAGVLEDKNNISPRLAVSFDPFNQGRTIFRGGYGLFQDQITLNQWLIIILNVINATDFVVVRNPGYPDPFGGVPQAQGPPNTELFDPNMNTPYAAQVTGGVKQQIGDGLALTADYVYVRGYDQLRRRDLNAPPDGTTLRPNAALGRQLIHESTGNRTHHALLLTAERRLANRWQAQATYTFSSTKSDSEARNSTALPTDQYDLSADWAPADVDARHNLVLTGQVVLPFDVRLAGILQLRSPYPFNVISGRDTNNDSRTGDRPDLDPNGIYPTNGMTEFGRFSIPVNRPGTLPRNAFDGPDFRQLDLRLSKTFPMRGRRLEVIAEAFNLTNRVNYMAYTSSILSAFFGLPQQAMEPRQVQLGVRFDF